MKRLMLALVLLVFLFSVFYVATGFVGAVLSGLPPSPWNVEAIKSRAVNILWFICLLLGLVVVVEAITLWT